MSYLPVMGILILVFASGIVLALLVGRLENSRGLSDRRDGSLVADGAAGVLGFLGGAAAFLLGVLMLASVDHFNATADLASQEAIAYSAAFDATPALPEPGRQVIQRDLACLVRSVATDSWEASTKGELAGDLNTQAWFTRTLADLSDVRAVEQSGQGSIDSVEDELIDAGKFGQQRLLSGESELPAAMWGLVYLSLFMLAFISTLMMRSHMLLLSLSLCAIFLVSAGMVAVLVAFAEPFDKDTGVYISPQAIEAVAIRLTAAYPGPAWDACERLVAVPAASS